MVLAQLNDLGLIAGNDSARFARREIGERRFPLNTWGGMLSAGQPGGRPAASTASRRRCCSCSIAPARGK
jgi:hypothetical protein